MYLPFMYACVDFNYLNHQAHVICLCVLYDSYPIFHALLEPRISLRIILYTRINDVFICIFNFNQCFCLSTVEQFDAIN